MKTEYRVAYLDRKTLQERVDVTNLPTGFDITFKPLRADHQHFAGLPLQLGWRSDPRQVLISANYAAKKPRHRPGLFCLLAV